VARINAVLRRKGPDELPGAPSETRKPLNSAISSLTWAPAP
jgi:hypothetical protein